MGGRGEGGEEGAASYAHFSAVVEGVAAHFTGPQTQVPLQCGTRLGGPDRRGCIGGPPGGARRHTVSVRARRVDGGIQNKAGEDS